jgi:acetylglutamate kinase
MTIVIKYGGNAMKDVGVRDSILDEIAGIYKAGHQIVLVHGGGPFINKILDQNNVQSAFIGGHRKTTTEAISLIEMALTGEVNPALVRQLQARGISAVGLSGKDGNLVIAKKKYHIENGKKVDIGWVGEVATVHPILIQQLLKGGFFPVLTCMASDSIGNAYNINGDLFAGHIAGAIKADQYIVMTDVDGLYLDRNKPETLIARLTLPEVSKMMGTVIAGGMIPKIESCITAIATGTKEVRIINGTKPGILTKVILGNEEIGTQIRS